MKKKNESSVLFNRFKKLSEGSKEKLNKCASKYPNVGVKQLLDLFEVYDIYQTYQE